MLAIYKELLRQHEVYGAGPYTYHDEDFMEKSIGIDGHVYLGELVDALEPYFK
jgi:hypothetical protein